MQENIIYGLGVSAPNSFNELKVLINSCLENEICHFDTAPSYHTEGWLGKIINSYIDKEFVKREHIIIQDKIDVWQMEDSKGNVRCYVEDSLNKMGMDYIDVIFVHWPLPEYLLITLEMLCTLKNIGMVKKVGVCNVNERILMNIINLGLKPDIIQIERNPLRICEQEINICKEYGIKVQSYSPLCKFHDDIRNSEVLKEMSIKYNKNIGQIVLRWHLDTGAVPVFTSKNRNRISEYSNIFDFSLDNEDIVEINKMNKNYKMYLESISCPGF